MRELLIVDESSVYNEHKRLFQVEDSFVISVNKIKSTKLTCSYHPLKYKFRGKEMLQEQKIGNKDNENYRKNATCEISTEF